MKWTIAIGVILSLILAVMIGNVVQAFQEGATDKKFQAKIPPPPQLSSEDVYAALGRAHAQIDLQAKYIGQLQQELTAAQALCSKPEEEEKK